MAPAKGAKRLRAVPPVDGHIVSGNIRIAQQLRALILRRFAKKLRPGALRSISSLKRGNLLLGNLKLPHNNEHAQPRSCLHRNAVELSHRTNRAPHPAQAQLRANTSAKCIACAWPSWLICSLQLNPSATTIVIGPAERTAGKSPCSAIVLDTSNFPASKPNGPAIPQQPA